MVMMNNKSKIILIKYSNNIKISKEIKIINDGNINGNNQMQRNSWSINMPMSPKNISI